MTAASYTAAAAFAIICIVRRSGSNGRCLSPRSTTITWAIAINVREPGPPREPFEQIQIVAAAVADSAFEAYQRIEYQESVPLMMCKREIELGVRMPTEAEVAQARKRLENSGPGLPLLSELEYSRETILLAEYPAR